FLCVRWYLSGMLSFRDLVAMMAERGVGMAHTTILEVGTALHPGVRKAVEAIRPPGRRILADGRDLYPGQGRVDVPLSSSRQEWQDCRFLPEPEARRKRRQGFPA